MYICKPERNASQARGLLFVSAAVTAILFLISTLQIPYASLVQLSGFVALIISIWLNVRYSLTEFEYSVGNGDFSVTRITGNRRQVVCNVALETAVSLLEKRDYDHLPSSEKAIIKYSLNQNMRAKSYVFLCDFNGKRAMIEFEPNNEFVAIFRDEISKYVSSEEE